MPQFSQIDHFVVAAELGGVVLEEVSLIFNGTRFSVGEVPAMKHVHLGISRECDRPVLEIDSGAVQDWGREGLPFPYL